MMNARFMVFGFRFLILTCLSISAVCIFAQTEEPPPSAPKSVAVPAVVEKNLRNGLTVAVIERKGVPMVTVQLLILGGASVEDPGIGGLANLTADMLTKGTKTRTATQIAEEMEFLGGSLNTGAGWNSSTVNMTVTTDKLYQAMAIMSDVVLNPTFLQKEIDLIKSQRLDELTYNLKQPTFLANYVATASSFDEHPAGGTPNSLKTLIRRNFTVFYNAIYEPKRAVLIFAGDINASTANLVATKYFGRWQNRPEPKGRRLTVLRAAPTGLPESKRNVDMIKSILVIDLPKSGQAAVSYTKKLSLGRLNGSDKLYYPASTFNSVLGGGYSSRLNYEIRIKRGLSYGAGSSFGWRKFDANFFTRAQTKNESAPEVAELVLAEIKKLTTSSVGNDELVPRKSVLTGGFGRNLETTGGLANALADLYAFDLPTSELNSYVNKVNAVTDAQVKDFAAQNLLGGDIIIVGDYSIFKDDLAKRFPGMKVEVIKADELDLSKDNLRK